MVLKEQCSTIWEVEVTILLCRVMKMASSHTHYYSQSVTKSDPGWKAVVLLIVFYKMNFGWMSNPRHLCEASHVVGYHDELWN